MITTSMAFLVGCSDQSLWSEGQPPSSDQDPVFTDDVDPGEDWDDDGDDGEDTGDDEGPWVGQWGEVVFTGSAVDEAVTGFVDWDGTAVRCEVAYELQGGTPVSDCASCTLAGTFTLGAAEVVTNVGGRCEELGWTGLEGESLTVGHADPETLWANDDGAWEAVGWSANDGTFWEFEIEYDTSDLAAPTASIRVPDGLPARSGLRPTHDRRERPTRP